MQLADTSTQQRRQQQLTNVVKDAMRESTQETLENARREAMAGSDVLSADILARAAASAMAPTVEVPGLSREASMDVDQTSPSRSLLVATDGDDDAAMDVSESPRGAGDEASSRSLEIEQRVNASLAGGGVASPRGGGATSPRPQAVPKRPMDADAISRFTTSSARPNKKPQLEVDESVPSSASSTSRGTVTSQSPRVKPPSLLDSILANKAAVAAATQPIAPATTDDDEHPIDIAPVPAVVPSPKRATTDAVKLITNTGGNEFSVVRNGTMKGEAWVHDRSERNILLPTPSPVARDLTVYSYYRWKPRQLQGIVKSSCHVEGRVKLEEFQRIVNKINTMRNDPRAPSKKYIVVFKMFVHGADKPGSSAAETYKNFCSEFTRDSRVALCNLTNAAQLYVVPPQLQDCLSMFSTLDSIPNAVGPSTAILYGLLTSKELGPAKYATAEPTFGMEGGFTLDEPVYGKRFWQCLSEEFSYKPTCNCR